MRSFLLQILRGVVVVVLSALIIYSGAFYYITGRIPSGPAEFKKVFTQLRELKPQEAASVNTQIAAVLKELDAEDTATFKADRTYPEISKGQPEEQPTTTPDTVNEIRSEQKQLRLQLTELQTQISELKTEQQKLINEISDLRKKSTLRE